MYSKISTVHISIKNKTAQHGIGHFYIDKTFIKTFLNKNSMDTAGLKKCPEEVLVSAPIIGHFNFII